MKLQSIEGGIERLNKFYEDHKQRYGSLLANGIAGNPNVRIEECKELLATWDSMKAKNWDFKRFTEDECFELLEACEDEGVGFTLAP